MRHAHLAGYLAGLESAVELVRGDGFFDGEDRIFVTFAIPDGRFPQWGALALSYAMWCLAHNCAVAGGLAREASR